MPEQTTRPDQPGAASWRWLVRVLLVAAFVWDVIVVSMLVRDARADDSDWAQGIWAVTGAIAALGLMWALLSSARMQLGRRSWMPVVCLVLVVGMASVVALG